MCRDLSLPIKGPAAAAAASSRTVSAGGVTSDDDEEEGGHKPVGKARLSPKQRKALMKQARPGTRLLHQCIDIGAECLVLTGQPSAHRF